MGHGKVRRLLSQVHGSPLSRMPVVIFLSDGECDIADETMYDLCRTAIRLG
jgi:hypothetical protein